MQCYASTKIKNRQGKSIEDLPVAKVANAFITVVTELRSATPNAAGIWMNGVSMMCIIQITNSIDTYSRFCGSFPVIRQATGRRPRGFSLFMKIFQGKSCRYFSNITFCFFYISSVKVRHESVRKCLFLAFSCRALYLIMGCFHEG
ncbi:hypothetical protein BvCmsKSNP065_04482 [Escherichia coli]|nr:hypothetical protein BvCmsKSNP065_04482 [Escherichia coli]